MNRLNATCVYGLQSTTGRKPVIAGRIVRMCTSKACSAWFEVRPLFIFCLVHASVTLLAKVLWLTAPLVGRATGSQELSRAHSTRKFWLGAPFLDLRSMPGWKIEKLNPTNVTCIALSTVHVCGDKPVWRSNDGVALMFVQVWLWENATLGTTIFSPGSDWVYLNTTKVPCGFHQQQSM